MTKTFATYTDLANEIIDAIIDRVPGAEYGRSNRSMSTYATLADANGGEHKVRVSDHEATGSCDGHIVAELLMDDLFVRESEEDGEFDHIETDHWWVAEEFIERAIVALTAVQEA